MKKMTADAAAMKLLQRQHGYARVAQLRQTGLTKDQVARRVRNGILERAARGVVGLPAVRASPASRAMRGVMLAGEGAVAALWTAAELHRMDAPQDGDTHILVLGNRRPRPADDVNVHRTRYLPASHRAVIDEVPVTSLDRTIVDCATQVDQWSALRILDSCSPSTRMWQRIHQTAEALSNGRPGVRAIAMVTAPDGAARLRSALERRARRALREHGVPQGEWNVEISDANGRIREVDVCYREARLIIEFDSIRHHDQAPARQKDRANDRRLVQAGWRVLRFGYVDVVYRSAQMASEIMAALHAL